MTYDNIIKSWLYASAPTDVSRTTSGTSATFQQTDSGLLDKLHCFTSTVDMLVVRGTGASVSAASGALWPAGVPLFFVPKSGKESVGFQTLDGSSMSASAPVTVFVCEDKVA